MNAHVATVMRVLLPALCCVLVLAAAPAFAQTPDLSGVSIEDLMNIQITSASRKEQRAEDVASAVFVITSDDIHRSGMTTVPDLLRLAPGVQVAQINATKWAVSVRGFNSLFANKLLVLVDGRSVYNRLFSGVYWDAGDVMLDDIDRIEVIRGPGAAIWGANAVNGVINIVTKATSQTKGGLVRVESGRAGTQGAARYGGTLGAASYRLYTQWTGRDASLIAPDTRASDWSRNVTAGFRSDWTTAPNTLMLEGAVTLGQSRALWPNLDQRTAALDPTSRDLSDTQSAHLLGRWTHARPGGASLQIQSFVDIEGRDEPPGRYDRRTVDIDAQYHTTLGARHDLVGGGAYRFSSDTFAGDSGFLLRPPGNTSSLVTAFLQDEIAFLDDRLTVTLGTQVQHDSYSGAGVQPSARVMWKADSRQRLWAAASRALRTPSLYERGLYYELPPAPSAGGLPVVVTVEGNPAVETEVLGDIEGGYRLELGTDASIGVTGFAGRYERLSTAEPGLPVVQFSPTPRVLVTTQFGNGLDATTRGLEISGAWKPVPAWRLDGSYTLFALSPDAVRSLDPDAALHDGSAPRMQWVVRSSLTPVPRAKIDVGIFHVGALERYQVPAYTRADVNAEWRFTTGLSAMLIGQNLLDAAHKEFGAGAGSFVLETEVPRSVSLRLRWAFR